MNHHLACHIDSLEIESITWSILARRSTSTYRNLTRLIIYELDAEKSTKLITFPLSLRIISFRLTNSLHPAVLASIKLLTQLESLTLRFPRRLPKSTPLDWTFLAPLKCLTSLHIEFADKGHSMNFQRDWSQLRFPQVTSLTVGFWCYEIPSEVCCTLLASIDLNRLHKLVFLQANLTGELVCHIASALPQLQHLEVREGEIHWQKALELWKKSTETTTKKAASEVPSISPPVRLLFPHVHTFLGFNITPPYSLDGICQAFSPDMLTTFGITENCIESRDHWNAIFTSYPNVTHVHFLDLRFRHCLSAHMSMSVSLIREKLHRMTHDYCQIETEQFVEHQLEMYPQLQELHFHNTVAAPFDKVHRSFAKACGHQVKVTITGGRKEDLKTDYWAELV